MRQLGEKKGLVFFSFCTGWTEIHNYIPPPHHCDLHTTTPTGPLRQSQVEPLGLLNKKQHLGLISRSFIYCFSSGPIVGWDWALEFLFLFDCSNIFYLFIFVLFFFVSPHLSVLLYSVFYILLPERHSRLFSFLFRLVLKSTRSWLVLNGKRVLLRAEYSTHFISIPCSLNRRDLSLIP